ncbi:MAG: hypothetical protein Fur003_3110 [Candidatus Dojkabacteria bacterium]
MRIRREVKGMLALFVLGLFLFSTIGFVYWFFVVKDGDWTKIGSNAGGSERLKVLISKSYLQSNDEYYLYAYKIAADGKVSAYNGYLETITASCPLNGACVTSNAAKPWGNYQVINGEVKVSFQNLPAGTITAQFRKLGSDWTWSNKVTVSIGNTNSLLYVPEWWNIQPNSSFTMNGYNSVYKKAFKTKIGYGSAGAQCSAGSGWMMSFAKDQKEGYWGAKVPWFNAAYNQNLLWSLSNFQKQSGWHDTYLTSTGYEAFTYNPQNLATDANFQDSQLVYSRRISSGDTKYPPYVLAPKYAGQGWGMINEKQTSKPVYGVDMCSITPKNCNVESCTGFRSSQSEVIKYKKTDGTYVDVVKFTHLEATDNFYKNANAFGWREDWYFVKNVGLVRIDTKHFGPTQNGSDIKPNYCQQDTDCLINSMMKNPHITLRRAGY